MDRRDWIEIGSNSEPEPLQQAVEELNEKWPGRFDFRIVPASAEAVAEKTYSLHLRHRPD